IPMSYRSQPHSGERKQARSRFYRPRLEDLEDRLPPGDTLGGLLAWSWWGPSAALLNPNPVAPESHNGDREPASNRHARPGSGSVPDTASGLSALGPSVASVQGSANRAQPPTSPAAGSQGSPRALLASDNALRFVPEEFFLPRAALLRASSLAEAARGSAE